MTGIDPWVPGGSCCSRRRHCHRVRRSSGLQQLDARCTQGIQQLPGGDGSNRGSHDSIEMKKASSVHPLEDLGLEEWMGGAIGSRFRPSMPKTATSAPKRTPSSNVIGMKAGQEEERFAADHKRVSAGVTHHCRTNLARRPSVPMTRTIQGSGESRRTMLCRGRGRGTVCGVPARKAG